LLEKYRIDNSQYSQMRLHSMACVALPTCALAMAESQRYLPSLISKLEVTLDEVGLRHDAITIRMTGCPNGCGRPYLAEIAFIGKAPGIYNLHLGGGFAGNRLNRIYREGVNEEQILEIVRPMLRNYAKERLAGEHFGDFLLRTKVLLPVYHGHSFWAKDESENDTSTRSGTVQLYW
jgi:sulfite reductase (NADPH) hemoprotein beta-component